MGKESMNRAENLSLKLVDDVREMMGNTQKDLNDRYYFS